MLSSRSRIVLKTILAVCSLFCIGWLIEPYYIPSNQDSPPESITVYDSIHIEMQVSPTASEQMTLVIENNSDYWFHIGDPELIDFEQKIHNVWVPVVPYPQVSSFPPIIPLSPHKTHYLPLSFSTPLDTGFYRVSLSGMSVWDASEKIDWFPDAFLGVYIP